MITSLKYTIFVWVCVEQHLGCHMLKMTIRQGVQQLRRPMLKSVNHTVIDSEKGGGADVALSSLFSVLSI